MPESAQKCIESWKQYCPDYQIREWNESNFNLNICAYVKEAYQEKKWAFVSDYARFWIIYNFGGFYLDTDVEIVKPIDKIIAKGAFMGCEPALLGTNGVSDLEGMAYLVNPGLGFAAPFHHPFIKEVLDSFENRSFYKSNGELDLTTIVETTTVALKRSGFKGLDLIQKIDSLTIYPSEYFCPKNYFTGELKLTENSYSIHHYTATWKSKSANRQFKVLQKLNSIFGNKLGYKMWRTYTFPSRVYGKLSTLGFKKTILFIFKKIQKK